MHQRALAAACLLGAFAVAACGPITEEDLQLWTRNDRGLKRIAEVVADPEVELATRIRALEVVVEKGFPTRVLGMIDPISEEHGLKDVTSGLRDKLMSHFADPNDPFQTVAKDGLIALQRYIDPAIWADIQQMLSKWAFRGVTWDADPDAIREAVEPRIAAGQIRDLGQWGWEGGAILISHGFLVDKMLDFLVDDGLDKHRTPQQRRVAAAHLFKGVERLHSRIGVQGHHIDALAKLPSADAAAYLLEMYLKRDEEDPKEWAFQEDIRFHAFNAATEMMKHEDVQLEKDKVAKKLLKLMESSVKSRDVNDRWLGAMNIVQMDEMDKLGEVLDLFKDDKVYHRSDEEAAKKVVDFCMDIHDRKLGPKALPVFRAKLLGNANRIVKAISLVCVKAMADEGSSAVVGELAKLYVPPLPEGVEPPKPKRPKRGEEPVEKPPDIDLDDFLGEKLTLGLLAKNTLEGVELLKPLVPKHKRVMDELEGELKKVGGDLDRHAKGQAKLPEPQRKQLEKRKRELEEQKKQVEERHKTMYTLIVVELAALQPEYGDLIKGRFAAWELEEAEKKKQAELAKKKPKAGPEKVAVAAPVAPKKKEEVIIEEEEEVPFDWGMLFSVLGMMGLVAVVHGAEWMFRRRNVPPPKALAFATVVAAPAATALVCVWLLTTLTSHAELCQRRPDLCEDWHGPTYFELVLLVAIMGAFLQWMTYLLRESKAYKQSQKAIVARLAVALPTVVAPVAALFLSVHFLAELGNMAPWGHTCADMSGVCFWSLSGAPVPPVDASQGALFLNAALFTVHPLSGPEGLQRAQLMEPRDGDYALLIVLMLLSLIWIIYSFWHASGFVWERKPTRKKPKRPPSKRPPGQRTPTRRPPPADGPKRRVHKPAAPVSGGATGG